MLVSTSLLDKVPRHVGAIAFFPAVPVFVLIIDNWIPGDPGELQSKFLFQTAAQCLHRVFGSRVQLLADKFTGRRPPLLVTIFECLLKPEINTYIKLIYNLDIFNLKLEAMNISLIDSSSRFNEDSGNFLRTM